MDQIQQKIHLHLDQLHENSQLIAHYTDWRRDWNIGNIVILLPAKLAVYSRDDGMMDIIVFSLIVAEQIRREISSTHSADHGGKGPGQRHGEASNFKFRNESRL